MRTDSHDGELTLPLPRIRVPIRDGEGDGPGGAARGGDSGGDGEGGPTPRRLLYALLAAVLAAVLGAGLWMIPSVRTILRQSFTQLPSPYTELYFTSAPSVSGTNLDVPVSVDAHTAAVHSFTVKVWLINGAGKTDAATTATLPAKDGAASSVVTIHVPGDAEVLYVSLVGSTEVLHYRIAGIPIPTSTG
jgi:hypothetical protein